MKRDVMSLAMAWHEAWHKYHDAPHQDSADEVVLNHNDEDWRDLRAKEQALLQAVADRIVH